jgi:4-hydroxy-3-methylbut-2-enyl diphosphate reductase
LIETLEEINSEDLRGAEKVGVTAGASTPKWLIDQVIKRLEEIGLQMEKDAVIA